MPASEDVSNKVSCATDAPIQPPPRRASHLWLLLAISTSWVGVAQLARAAEKSNETLQRRSVVPLMTWANASAWMLLCIPHVARAAQRAGDSAPLLSLLQTDAFGPRQPPRFLAIALSTNLSYIAALHYLPASLNTALFCISPIFTLALSLAFLGSEARGPGTGRLPAVLLSVLGVLLITEPWRSWGAHDESGRDFRSRAIGAGFSLLAAAGTAVYQVYFKATFGDRMGAEEVGLFLAHMGALASLLCGVVGVFLLASGFYRLELSLVPWELVGACAISSALFNYLIKFGLSRDSPVVVSLATQIGIPLNLLLDVTVVGASIDATEAVGTLVMAASFALQQRAIPKAAALDERLLGDPADRNDRGA